MHCVVCGEATDGPALCDECFLRIPNPMTLVYDALDPLSDARLRSIGSVRVNVHPRADPLPTLEPVPDIAPLLDGETVESLVDSYLANLGIGVHLEGDERLPDRPEAWDVAEASWDHSSGTERWARASVRMANLYALVIRGVASMRISTRALGAFLEVYGERARTLWARADGFPNLRTAALANEALLDHWVGDTERAIDVLGHMLDRGTDWDRSKVGVKLATVLLESGDRDAAVRVLESLPSRKGRVASLLEEARG